MGREMLTMAPAIIPNTTAATMTHRATTLRLGLMGRTGTLSAEHICGDTIRVFIVASLLRTVVKGSIRRPPVEFMNRLPWRIP
jgi:hypothetical protein